MNDVIIQNALKKKFNTNDCFKHIACVYSSKNNKIIAYGENRIKNFCKKNKCTSCFLHAEMDVVQKVEQMKHLKFKQEKFNLIVIRIKENNNLGMSRPCYLCVNKIFHSKIKFHHVYYSNSQGDIEKEKLNELYYGKKYFSYSFRTKLQKYLQNNNFMMNDI